MQEPVHGQPCAEGGNQDAEQEHGTGSDGQHLPRHNVQHTRLREVESIDTCSQHTVSQQGSNYAHPNGLLQERATDKAPRGSHQLHGVDDKPSGINAQAHRVADERERHKGQQHCQYQQDDAHTTQVGIYLVHQVFHIRQVAHPGILAQLLGNPLQ